MVPRPRATDLVRLAHRVLPLLAGGLLVGALVRAYRDVPPVRNFEFVDGTVVRVESIRPTGDLVLDDGLVVRLLGVEFAEDDPGEAVDWLGERARGRDVVLRFDRERVDDDERILAYVDVESENLNLAVVAAGLARVDRRAAFSASVKRAMQKAEAAAESAGLGLWASD